MWIKICANTNLEDAQLAAETGANALGFVFAESPRRVTAAEVSLITPHIPDSIEKYGVFVNADFEAIVRTIQEAGLTGVQLHTSHDPSLPVKLREHFGPALRILQVIHYTQDLETQFESLRHANAVDAVLVDSRTASAVGGTGTSFDWHSASHSFQDHASNLRLIAAGGLNPENVTAAIHTLRPWGVDVVTGVEASPGKKDPARIKAFIAAVRIAAEETTPASR